MSIDKHMEHREWTFGALDTLQAFIEDEDFDGDAQAERRAMESKRTELQEGKYRVVFLGAFNVGKSTLINAFLGDEYLPAILEECTTKITHIQRAQEMCIELRVTSPVPEEEVRDIEELLHSSSIEAQVALNELTGALTVTFTKTNPRELLTTLKALVTMNADEDFPRLRGLRGRFDELVIRMPNVLLEEDIALVDSPGVHSISETNKKIAHEIIPQSHLVICMLDSQNAGNEQNRDFIESVVRHRHRKVFFVINKADQLNPEEIDPLGRRGPAKDLMRGLQEVVANPELFFISSLYAMTAAQLAGGRIEMAEVENNQKIRMPFRALQDIYASDNPGARTAEYLLEKSNFPTFRERLLAYLYNENKEGAIVEAVCRFIDGNAYRFARPIEIKLDLARNVPRLDELRRKREQMSAELEKSRTQAIEIEQEFATMSEGGSLHGTTHEGFQKLPDSLLSKAVFEEKVVDPVRKWLDVPENFVSARGEHFKPLQNELEKAIDAVLEDRQTELWLKLSIVENKIRERLQTQQGPEITPKGDALNIERLPLTGFKAGLSASYLGFGLTGAILGAGICATGGAAAMNSPDLSAQLAPYVEQLSTALQQPLLMTEQTGALLGTAIGFLPGAMLGFLLRAVNATPVRKERLKRQIEEKAEAVRQDFVKRLTAAVNGRRDDFSGAIQRAYDKANSDLVRDIRLLREEEDSLRREQEDKIARLEPKLESLKELGAEARRIADLSVAKSAG